MHIFVRPKGTITNSTKCIIAFKESDFEESDGIILMPGHTAHVRSKKPSNDGTSDIASGSGRKEESSKDIEDVPACSHTTSIICSGEVELVR